MSPKLGRSLLSVKDESVGWTTILQDIPWTRLPIASRLIQLGIGAPAIAITTVFKSRVWSAEEWTLIRDVWNTHSICDCPHPPKFSYHYSTYEGNFQSWVGIDRGSIPLKPPSCLRNTHIRQVSQVRLRTKKSSVYAYLWHPLNE